MEGSQIVRSGDERWKLIGKIKKEAADASNNLMYLLAEHLEKYGAARGDVLDYLAGHPLKSVNSRAIIDKVNRLVQGSLPASWMESVQGILEEREDRVVLYLEEMERAASAGIPNEMFQKGMELARTPYDIHLYLDEKIGGFMESMENKERNRMLLLEGLADGMERGRGEMDGLLARMEKCLERMEHAMEHAGLSGNAPSMLAEMEGEAAAGMESEERKETEEMFFDESWLPETEYDEEDVRSMEEMPEGDSLSSEKLLQADNSGEENLVPELDETPERELGDDPMGEGEALVPELDDVPELSAEDGFAEGFMPDLEDGGPEAFLDAGQEREAEDVAGKAEASDAALPDEDGADATGVPLMDESAPMEEETFRSEEEAPRRYKRLMSAAARLLAMEKRRFLGKDSDAQREFLLKRLLEKKAGASKVNAFKNLFGSFSNEYLYDLVIRDATEAELENLLTLSQS